MEKQRYCFFLIFFIVLSLGIVSFVCCIIAESKKAKIRDVKVDDKLCYLPESHAFRVGNLALICGVIAQIIASTVILSNCCIRRNENSSKATRPTIASIILVLAWISFAIAVILLSTATSMSKKQLYGKGWLDRQCYLVKDGVYTGSGVLVVVSVAGTIGSAILTITNRRLKPAPKIHAQGG